VTGTEPEVTVDDAARVGAPGDQAPAPSSGESWTEVSTVKELARYKKKLVEVDGEQIALFHADGKVYALHDVCIHKQRSLSKGIVMGGKVICPGHQWMFDVETGWVEEEERCQPSYAVKVDEEGVVYVDPHPRVLRDAGDADD